VLVGIISGYYRSGTTIMQRIYELSNPNHIVLCEPTQHEIIDHILANGCYNKNVLHGWEIFNGYCKLPRELLHSFILRHFDVFDTDKSNWGIMTSLGAITHLLTPLYKSNLPIVIKTTQLQLFLSDCANIFGCWVIHLERSTENTIASHLSMDMLENPELAKNLLLKKGGILPFYGHLVYENLTKALGVSPENVENNLDKLVFNIEMTKILARKHAKVCDKVIIVDFDDLVINPQKWLSKFPFKISDSALKLLSPSKQKKAPDWLKEMVLESKEKLGFA